MSSFDLDMAFTDIMEVIPDILNMNRPNTDFHFHVKNENVKNHTSLDNSYNPHQDWSSYGISEFLKMSMDVNQISGNFSSDIYNNPRANADQSLVYMTQRQFDGCTCPSHASDMSQCKCSPNGRNQMRSFKSESKSYDDIDSIKANQAQWINGGNRDNNLLTSLIVPDPSIDYPYYLDYPFYSMYDQEMPVVPKTQNSMGDKSMAFTGGYQRVPCPPRSYKVPSPVGLATITDVRPRPSRPRLCHFLIELLANPSKYSKIIEWVDEENGVFKFLDSAEVALEWGRRRNKPHMKYENFARSLRTYIAKGILTKPRSKLVYRFKNKIV